MAFYFIRDDFFIAQQLQIPKQIRDIRTSFGISEIIKLIEQNVL